jgi:hypothetical protein
MVSREWLQRYERVISAVHMEREESLRYLRRRDRALTTSVLFITITAIASAGATLIFGVINRISYAFAAPLASLCLAALAISFKQLQGQNYQRLKDVVLDINSEERISGVIAAILSSSGEIPSDELVQRLTEMLSSWRSDPGVDGVAADPRERPIPGNDNIQAADPISIFLKTG